MKALILVATALLAACGGPAEEVTSPRPQRAGITIDSTKAQVDSIIGWDSVIAGPYRRLPLHP